MNSQKPETLMSLAILGFLLAACSKSSSAIDELMAADRAFSARSVEIGAGPAFVEFASPEVRVFPGGGTVRKGKAELENWTASWPEERVVEWEPEEAFASAAGDFGYTWGYASFTRPAENGQSTVNYAKYLTVWRRQPDGSWKWIADVGNSAPPPEER